ncbi:enoyl-CoA hydratase/carnithine racemase [Sinobacterium caligoides]|uniref:3-hydroxyisobutyryl-CoA hydrolase n=1 Tax=Sinobacterium caligoides TaxID=933926 RepID=A0A3N2DGZ8_9GAMM|nr:enoyl-CoA hydratase/isomerase family protein [Sinobacterium caligoides]ROR99076.1 enoyl-CoA hydratase/carnithine racemase [Sinobacterium caligoides]
MPQLLPLPSVLCDEVVVAAGKIGVLTLNAPARMNALNGEMIALLRESLIAWQTDPELLAVMLFADSHKVFCAGGDVRAVREEALLSGGDYCEAAERFFEAEYRLDYLLHRYPKPVIAWGEGVVLGGGLGLLAGASHRVVTPSSRLAMPELAIGFYPDVGAGYFLNQMPGRSGYLLGLTGSLFAAADALYTGVADYCLADESRALFIEQLHQQAWLAGDQPNSAEHNALLLSELLAAMQVEAGDSWIAADQQEIDRLCGGDDGLAIIESLLSYRGESQTIQNAVREATKGSPLAARVTIKQLLDSRDKTLAEVFIGELGLSTKLAQHREFQEGVRAQLVDKDKQPQWQHQHPAEVLEAELAALFTPPWPVSPLDDLC